MAAATDSHLALVTGAAGAIGSAIVGRLLAAGHRVLAIDQGSTGLEALCSAYPSSKLTPITFDLADAAGTPAFLLGVVDAHGPVTRLVLNAGVWPGARIADMPDEIWQLNFAVNVTSPFLFLRGLATAMADAGGGAVVCTASRNAHRSSTGNAAYDASKAALLGLVRTAAGEFAQDRICINAISPGVVSTASTAEIEEEPFRAAYLRQIPLDRYGTAEDIAGVCLFLLSADAAYITGQDIIVDGGQIACQDNSRLILRTADEESS